MFESRCGVECNKCENKGKWKCKGCLNMEQPTWGVCEVKRCCENKKLNFCGECESFPCSMLQNMGKDYGYDPSIKINQCKKWLSEQRR